MGTKAVRETPNVTRSDQCVTLARVGYLLTKRSGLWCMVPKLGGVRGDAFIVAAYCVRELRAARRLVRLAPHIKAYWQIAD